MITGRGRFQKRRVVDGRLEIKAAAPPEDARLREWIDESRVVLPILQALVKLGPPGPGLRLALDDLRRRVEVLERELARARRERHRA